MPGATVLLGLGTGAALPERRNRSSSLSPPSYSVTRVALRPQSLEMGQATHSAHRAGPMSAGGGPLPCALGAGPLLAARVPGKAWEGSLSGHPGA